MKKILIQRINQYEKILIKSYRSNEYDQYPAIETFTDHQTELDFNDEVLDENFG